MTPDLVGHSYKTTIQNTDIYCIARIYESLRITTQIEIRNNPRAEIEVFGVPIERIMETHTKIHQFCKSLAEATLLQFVHVPDVYEKSKSLLML